MATVDGAGSSTATDRKLSCKKTGIIMYHHGADRDGERPEDAQGCLCVEIGSGIIARQARVIPAATKVAAQTTRTNNE